MIHSRFIISMIFSIFCILKSIDCSILSLNLGDFEDIQCDYSNNFQTNPNILTIGGGSSNSSYAFLRWDFQQQNVSFPFFLLNVTLNIYVFLSNQQVNGTTSSVCQTSSWNSSTLKTTSDYPNVISCVDFLIPQVNGSLQINLTSFIPLSNNIYLRINDSDLNTFSIGGKNSSFLNQRPSLTIYYGTFPTFPLFSSQYGLQPGIIAAIVDASVAFVCLTCLAILCFIRFQRGSVAVNPLDIHRIKE